MVLCSSFCANFNHHHKFFIFKLYCYFCFSFFSTFNHFFSHPFYRQRHQQKKYYQHHKKDEISNLKIIFEIFKIFIKFMGIFLLCTLALFLPFINLFVYYLTFYYLFHKLLMLDITSTVLDKEGFKSFHSNFSPLEFKFSTLCFYLISSVPLLGLFLQVFFVIFLTHLSYQRILKLEVKA